MDRSRRTVANWAAMAAVLLFVAGCGLPRPGPNAEEIVAASTANGGAVSIVPVNNDIARRAFLAPNIGFSAEFLNAVDRKSDQISPGDSLSITVWENVENGLLVGTGQKVALLQEIQVDQGGNIFMPYAGTLRVSGMTPDEVRQEITNSLGTQTPDPQVEVRRTAGDGATVNLIGSVGAQGVYPIEPSTSTLASMLANAGGATVDPDIAVVSVRRSGKSGRIFLKDLFDHPSLDIALRPDDTIIVEEDRRSFTALGATGTQARVRFPQGEINVVEALAEVGGLNGTVSDPTGIFIFRREQKTIADRVLGRQDMYEGAPFAYVIDLTSPEGFFVAKEFQVRDDDTIYITEAPFAAWARILEATSSSLDFATEVVRLVDTAN